MGNVIICILCFTLFFWTGRPLLQRGDHLYRPPFQEAPLNDTLPNVELSKGGICLLLFCCGDVEMNPGPR